jgi:hypothetical protein
VSNKSWVLGAQVSDLPHTKAKRSVSPGAEILLTAMTEERKISLFDLTGKRAYVAGHRGMVGSTIIPNLWPNDPVPPVTKILLSTKDIISGVLN